MVRRTTGSSSRRSVQVTRSIRSRSDERDSRSEQRRSRRDAAHDGYDEQRLAPQPPRRAAYDDPRQNAGYGDALPGEAPANAPLGAGRPRPQQDVPPRGWRQSQEYEQPAQYNAELTPDEPPFDARADETDPTPQPEAPDQPAPSAAQNTADSFGRRRPRTAEDRPTPPPVKPAAAPAPQAGEPADEDEEPQKPGFFGRRRRDDDYEDEIEESGDEQADDYEEPKKRGFFGRRRHDDDYEDEIEEGDDEQEDDYEEPKKRGFFGRRRRDDDYEDEIEEGDEQEDDYEEPKKRGFFGRRHDDEEDDYDGDDGYDGGDDDGYGGGRSRGLVWVIVLIIALLGTLAAMGFYFREDILDLIAKMQQGGQIAATATPEATLPPAVEATPEPTVEPTATPQPQASDDPNTICVNFVGEMTAYQLQLDDAQDGAGEYDFSHNFADIAPYLSAGDLSIGSLSTTVAGSELTYTGQPKFNSPESLLQAMSAAGMDALITANARAFDQGWVGVTKTLQNIENAGMKATGTYLSKEDYYEPLIVEVKGVKIAILAYTDKPDYADNMSQEKLNFCYKSINMNTVKKDVATAKEKGAQIILASVHWGAEDKRTPTDQMQEYAQKMMDMGVDVIFGTHPQMLQKTTRKTVTVDGAQKDSLVAYSLGNFLSSRRNQYNDSGMILTVNFKKNDDGSVTMGDVTYLPTWVCVNDTDQAAEKNFRILPVGKYVDDETLLGTLDAKAQTRIKQIWDETTATVGSDGITAVRQ
ncbi:MAG: CapA family protein [Eubacteriales bacterium]|nr:CapA family protein [Eubacteriales bacterium]